jgi:tetratricopeptide (TPR) repeat protein
MSAPIDTQGAEQEEVVAAPSRLVLPEAPVSEKGAVKAWQEPVEMRTYLPAAPDKNPMFLERRVYQGSSGRVYPLPCIDRVATESVPKLWQAVHIENEYLRVMVLPELGGRIHIGLDKRNGYDFFYRQNVIKPALVGLAGPWLSGGVEFNWPQHHRPATFMPVEVHIERGRDGSVTVWCSDHDPIQRMKGMHGICLHPGRAYIELKARLYNRTLVTQTFLWWANCATQVHEHYQSFFPPDVRWVADHAKRAVTSFPLSDRAYYGVDYPERARTGVPEEEAPPCFQPDGLYAANDLSWYANIPVPTSYMVTHTAEDFFGGYDHAKRAGMVHVANHHIAPGKKQWTWGNHEFGYAWDRSLTDDDGPYIELMAGVYTDNQPDFSYLAPGETKTFSQFWYPIREIGPPQAASVDVALHCEVRGQLVELGIAVTRDIPDATIILSAGGETLKEWNANLEVWKSLALNFVLPPNLREVDIAVEILEANKVLLGFAPALIVPSAVPAVATEPPQPEDISTLEQLYLTGVHLEQYRHATRLPELYWQEALRRDAGDSRTNTAIGRWHLQRGELTHAERHLRCAIARLTERNPNPAESDAYYYLGLALRLAGRSEEAYAAFYKATWVAAWRGPAYHALAEMDASAHHWRAALDHVQRALRADADNNRATALMCAVLAKLGHEAEIEPILREACDRDPLDVWFRFLRGRTMPQDGQQSIDLALDQARAGLFDEAEALLANASDARPDGAGTMALYLRAWLYEQRGESELASELSQLAAEASPDYVFPSRIEEMLALEAACRRDPGDARASYYLGNLLYDKRRHEEAIARWQVSADLDSDFPTVWRNLGLGFFNIQHDADAAVDAFERAFAADPGDARILYERDQLWKRVGIKPHARLAELEQHAYLITHRDDLSVEFATLLNQTGQAERALRLLAGRHFQPWEGGEGMVLAQFVRANMLLAKESLLAGDPQRSVACCNAALLPPQGLSEASHLLANQSDVYYLLGVAYDACGEAAASRRALSRAAHQRGDFQQMSVRLVSEMTYWSAKAEEMLGNQATAMRIFGEILAYADQLSQEPAGIDYFATSLPAMLLFEEDLAQRQRIMSLFLRAQALSVLAGSRKQQPCWTKCSCSTATTQAQRTC